MAVTYLLTLSIFSCDHLLLVALNSCFPNLLFPASHPNKRIAELIDSAACIESYHCPSRSVPMIETTVEVVGATLEDAVTVATAVRVVHPSTADQAVLFMTSNSLAFPSEGTQTTSPENQPREQAPAVTTAKDSVTGLHMTLQNVVVTVYLGCLLDLKM